MDELKVKPKVMYSPVLREWFVMFQGHASWFTRWVDAYSYAYTVARVRNVAADALATVQAAEETP